MESFFQYIAVHKDALDIIIKAVGLIVAASGAIWTIRKHYSDKAEARRAKELELRRDAYFSLFKALPIQIGNMGKFFAQNREPFQVTQEIFAALYKLHLHAHKEPLEHVVQLNGIFHEGLKKWGQAAMFDSAEKRSWLCEILGHAKRSRPLGRRCDLDFGLL